MSRTIKILQCRKCGEELYRKEEGEYRNPNGTWSSNTQVFKIDEKYCSHCTGKIKEVITNEKTY